MNVIIVIFFLSYSLYAFMNNLKFWFIYIILLAIYYYITQYKIINQCRENISRKIFLSAWQNPYDPQTYTTMKLDITKIIPYLKKKSEEIKEHLTPTIYTIKLMAIILKKYPEVYGYIKFGRYETKNGVDICCLVQVGDGQELSNATIYDCEKKNFKKITEELKLSVKSLRQKKNKSQKKRNLLFKFVPTFITGPFQQITTYLSSVGINCNFIGLRKFEFGSFLISSIGSLGIDDSFAPIPPLSFAPLLLTLCSKYNVNLKNENGEIETKTYLKMNFTSDYRFFDTSSAIAIMKDIHLIGENPELFENECKKYESEKN